MALDPDYIRDLFVRFGQVSIRRMFSGSGLYADGLIFALVSKDVIYLKADDTSIPLFEAEGLAPFGYETKDGRRVLTSYWRMPDRLYDDPDELAEWARRALAAARAKATRDKAAGRAKPTRNTASAKKKSARGKKVSPKRPASARGRRPRGRSRK